MRTSKLLSDLRADLDHLLTGGPELHSDSLRLESIAALLQNVAQLKDRLAELEKEMGCCPCGGATFARLYAAKGGSAHLTMCASCADDTRLRLTAAMETLDPSFVDWINEGRG